MKKPRLATRIRSALQLQPMTIHQVARCLSVSDQTAQKALVTLTRRRIIRRIGWAGERHKAHLFELRNRAIAPGECPPINAQAREGDAA